MNAGGLSVLEKIRRQLKKDRKIDKITAYSICQ